MKETFLAGRILLGGYFLFAGSHHFTQVGALAEAAGRHHVPWPTAAVLGGGVLLLIGGVTLMFGIAPRLGLAAVVLFLIPVTVVMHPFWRESGVARMMDLINFSKNVGLLGSVMMLSAFPEPWPYAADGRRHLPRHANV